MEQKEIKINIPEGYEIDKENSSFECIKFKRVKKELPKTWEEFCKTHPWKYGESWITEKSYVQIIKDESGINREDDDRNVLPNEEYAKAMLALCQLIQLRDCYNNGWVPDWTDNNDKYTIVPYKNTLNRESNLAYRRILAFKTEKLRNKFFENFRDLIETAKPLL